MKSIFSSVLILLLSVTVAYSAEFNYILKQFLSIEQGTVFSRDMENSILEAATSDGQIPARLLVFGKGGASELTALGGSIQTSAGDYYTALIPSGYLSEFFLNEEIEYLSYGPQVTAYLDSARDMVNVEHSYLSGYEGDDVIVGIIDSGIDLDHPDFSSENGLTRVLYLWDQISTGDGPSGFDYGVEWTKSQIDLGVYHGGDDVGHGTHVAGIAAGSGAGSNGKYQGMSPSANIVFVKLSFDNANYIFDAVNYIFQKADELDKPCVINLSLGFHAGNHRADDPYNLFMDEIVNSANNGEGRVLVWAAGNEGSDPIHTTNLINSSSDTSIEIDFQRLYSGNDILPIAILFYYTNDSKIPVKVLKPGGGTEIAYTTEAQTATSEAYVENGEYTPGEYYTYVVIQSSSQGTWNVTFDTMSSGSTPVDGYIISSYYNGEFLDPVYEGTLSVSAAQEYAIAVGAVTTKTIVTNYLNQIIEYTNSSLYDIAEFSSLGPARDGSLKPDISAPGVFVVAPLSGDIDYSGDDMVSENYVAWGGTSMAAPVVTGIIAQLLEANPSMTVSEVRTAITTYCGGSSVYKPSFGLGNWDNAFGYGVIDAEFITETDFSEAAVEINLKNNVLNFSADSDNLFILQVRGNSSQVNETIQVKIYDSSGNLIRDYDTDTINGIEVKEYVWDGNDQYDKQAAPGVYFAMVQIGSDVERYTLLVAR